MRVMLAEMSWPEVKERIGADTVAVIPVASTEQHGPHLPLSTDAIILSECTRRAAERVAGRIPIVVTPTLPLGFSRHHMQFPGTLTLSMPTYLAVLNEVCESLIEHGFRKLLLLNGHGGNQEAIQVAVRQVVAAHDVVAGAANYWTVAAPALEQAGASAVGIVPGHSAGFETSCLLALRPDLVDMEKLPPPGDQSVPESNGSRLTVKPMGVMTAVHESQRPESGVWGDPALVRPELGEKLVEAIVAALADVFLAFSTTESY